MLGSEQLRCSCTIDYMKGYEHILELLHLSGLQRTTALQLIEGLEIVQTEETATKRFSWGSKGL